MAGNSIGPSVDGSSAVGASLQRPAEVAVDAAGTVYFLDTGQFRIRKIDPLGGDGGPATLAAFNAAQFVAADTAGNLYIGNPTARRVRRVDAAGTITIYAGNGTVGTAGDGGPAVNAQFLGISALAVDGSGNLYIADSHRISKSGRRGDHHYRRRYRRARIPGRRRSCYRSPNLQSGGPCG